MRRGGGGVGYGASQVRAEVEMNDCENLLRAKPQPAGVQIDRKEIDIHRYMCVSLSLSHKRLIEGQEEGGRCRQTKQSAFCGA